MELEKITSLFSALIFKVPAPSIVLPELLLKITLAVSAVMFKLPLSLYIVRFELFSNWLSDIFTVPLFLLYIALPYVAELPVKVLSIMVKVPPSLYMVPP